MPRYRPLLTRGESAIEWIEIWCANPGGKGVQLTPPERAAVYAIFDAGIQEPIEGRLAAFLTLLGLAGPSEFRLETEKELFFRSDVFSVWTAAGSELRGYLCRQGATISCPERKTIWRAVA